MTFWPLKRRPPRLETSGTNDPARQHLRPEDGRPEVVSVCVYERTISGHTVILTDSNFINSETRTGIYTTIIRDSTIRLIWIGLNYFLFYVLRKIQFTGNGQSYEHTHFDMVTFLETDYISVILLNVRFHYNAFLCVILLLHVRICWGAASQYSRCSSPYFRTWTLCIVT
jgi:hypothetical protein